MRADVPERWGLRAGLARAALVSEYWDRRSGLFRIRPGALAWLRWRLGSGPWHYWWQAHALQALLDGVGTVAPGGAERARRHVSGIVARCGGEVTDNPFVDDLSWLGLATLRAYRLGVIDARLPLELSAAVLAGHDPELGGFRWRIGDDFHNVAASAPAATLLAGTAELAGDPARWDLARATADWLHAQVVDPSGLVWDGCRPRGGVLLPEGRLWSYNVGTVAGLDVVLAADAAPDQARVLLDRAARVVRAGTGALRAGCADVATGRVVLAHAADPAAPADAAHPAARIWRDEPTDGVGADPQLFRGILARGAVELVLADPDRTGDIAADVVTQARAAWRSADGRGRIGSGWNGPSARTPTLAAHLAGTLVLGGVARLERAGLA